MAAFFSGVKIKVSARACTCIHSLCKVMSNPDCGRRLGACRLKAKGKNLMGWKVVRSALREGCRALDDVDCGET